MLLQQHSFAAGNRAEKASKEGEWSGQEVGEVEVEVCVLGGVTGAQSSDQSEKKKISGRNLHNLHG